MIVQLNDQFIMFFLGIDVAKAKLDCMLLDSATNKQKSKVVPNTGEGFKTLLEWLDKQKSGMPSVIMEPTGVYHEAVAYFLVDSGFNVALVNPAQLRKFAQGVGVKTKTDKADSAVLARYGATQHPQPWQPPPVSVRTLKALLTRRDAIAEDLLREQNRQEKNEATDVPALVRDSIESSIAHLKAELKRLESVINQHIDNDPDLRDKKQLLETIPGVGERVSTHFTALLAGRDFDRAEQLAAYLGLVPVQWESGSSVHGRPRMSKAGPGHLRKLLYMPAVVATKRNPHVKDLYERLLGRGKSEFLSF